jgi:hypothetical protein
MPDPYTAVELRRDVYKGLPISQWWPNGSAIRPSAVSKK